MFIWQRPDWPQFRHNDSLLLHPLGRVRLLQGNFLGQMSQLGLHAAEDALLRALVSEIVKSYEIEGERLPPVDVRSSMARRLGIPTSVTPSGNLRVEGATRVVVDAVQNYEQPLTRERLWDWHRALFPSETTSLRSVQAGRWRTDENGPMQVVSGPIGRETLHFEAPPAALLDQEVDQFLSWFNSGHQPEPLLRAAIAHLWFVTLHPFDDGNGRIARAITDLALARAESSNKRYYSLSAQLQLERSAYYRILETTQRGGLDVTEWLLWFLDCLQRAIEGAQTQVQSALAKSRFWQQHAHSPLNDRQRKVLNRWFDGLEGHMTTRKWAALAKCSHPTAQRDVAELIELGIVTRNPGGSKNTTYRLNTY